MSTPAVVDPAVEFLADAAQGGRALEFAIGTGRIALPLSERRVPVHGIDISADMLEQLRRKPGAENVTATLGDYATTTIDGTFSLVYVVFNSIANVLEQAECVQTFRNAAANLASGGRFVVELWIPDLRRFPPGAVALPFAVESQHLGFDTFDIAHSRGTSHHYYLHNGRVETFESPFRFCVPGRTRPDRSPRRHDVARTLGRLGPLAVHKRQRQTHFRLREALLTRRHLHLAAMASEELRTSAAVALRNLIHAFVASDPGDDQLVAIRRLAEQCTGDLGAAARRDRMALIRQRSEGRLMGGVGFEDRAVGGLANPTSVGFTVRHEGNEVVADVVLGKAFEGAPGRAHGGIVAATFDDVTGFVIGQLQEPAFTGELTVRYVAPVPVEQPLEMRARLDGRERRKLFISGECRHDGTVIATCKAIYVTVDPSRFAGAPDPR